MPGPSPEKVILTNLHQAQRRCRMVQGVRSALRWFAVGSVVASAGLVLLWNWDRLPGWWQWFASAQRPLELLWLAPLLGLGGFLSGWLRLPPARTTAYQLDRWRGSQERLLTAVDWILSEKPRTPISERLLLKAAAEFQEPSRWRRELTQFVRVPPRDALYLGSLALPLALWWLLPPHLGLPESAALWLGQHQVERLTEAVLKEVNPAEVRDAPEQRLAQLLRQLETPSQEAKPQGPEALTVSELPRLVAQLQRQARAQESMRELLETLSQRARQGQALNEVDRQALQELQRRATNASQREQLQQALQDWAEGRSQEAAEALEQLQQQAGQEAERQRELARQGQQSTPEGLPQGGQEFQERLGDQAEGLASQAQGDAPPPGPGDPGRGPGDFGQGSTEDEQPGQGAQGRQSLRQSPRTSEKTEEFRHLHPPVRSEFPTAQTRVPGQPDPEGQRFRTDQEGRGAVTQPAHFPGADGLLQYREQAENAILREEIPAEYREDVRQYFELLDR